MADVSKLITKKLAQAGYTLVKDMRALHRDGEIHYVIGTNGDGYTLFQAPVNGKDVSLAPMVWNAKLDDAMDYAYDFVVWWNAYGSAEPDGLWGGYSNGRKVEDDRPKVNRNRRNRRGYRWLRSRSRSRTWFWTARCPAATAVRNAGPRNGAPVRTTTSQDGPR